MIKKQSTLPLSPTTLGIITVVVIALLALIAWGIAGNLRACDFEQQNATLREQSRLAAHDDGFAITPLDSNQASNNPDTAKKLTYLIEEEKLAHDVYQAMYDKWGARVFGNIKNSEATHQELVWAIMKSRGMSDPRSDKAGVFTDPTLQATYDKLIAQGSQSVNEAYKVGIAIEEMDIADLKDTIAKLDALDTDVQATLDNLLFGSENHLRAFTRQASR